MILLVSVVGIGARDCPAKRVEEYPFFLRFSSLSMLALLVLIYQHLGQQMSANKLFLKPQPETESSLSRHGELTLSRDGRKLTGVKQCREALEKYRDNLPNVLTVPS